MAANVDFSYLCINSDGAVADILNTYPKLHVNDAAGCQWLQRRSGRAGDMIRLLIQASLSRNHTAETPEWPSLGCALCTWARCLLLSASWLDFSVCDAIWQHDCHQIEKTRQIHKWIWSCPVSLPSSSHNRRHSWSLPRDPASIVFALVSHETLSSFVHSTSNLP